MLMVTLFAKRTVWMMAILSKTMVIMIAMEMEMVMSSVLVSALKAILTETAT